MVALLVGMCVVLLGWYRGASQDLAWQALLNNIEFYRSAYEEGLFIIDLREKKPKPLFIELGRIPLNEWLKGIRAYGVRVKEDKVVHILEKYTTKFPIGLRQIESGDSMGNFTNSDGDIIVPGVQYFSDSTKRAQALGKISAIENFFDNKLKEAKLDLREIETF